MMFIFYSYYSYDVFIPRILLAALDHNFHLFRDDLRDSTGQVRYKKQYSKTTEGTEMLPTLATASCQDTWKEGQRQAINSQTHNITSEPSKATSTYYCYERGPQHKGFSGG